MLGSMAIPDLDVARIRRWCAGHSPAHLRDEVRVECAITDRHVTIYETRPPWDGSDQPWTEFPIARLRYTAATGLWSLYWRDRNSRFHEYKYREPSPSVVDLLDHIDNSGDPIFWG